MILIAPSLRSSGPAESAILMQEPAAPPSTDQPLKHAALPGTSLCGSFRMTRSSLTVILRHVRKPPQSGKIAEGHAARLVSKLLSVPDQTSRNQDHPNPGTRNMPNVVDDVRRTDKYTAWGRDIDRLIGLHEDLQGAVSQRGRSMLWH